MSPLKVVFEKLISKKVVNFSLYKRLKPLISKDRGKDVRD